MKIKVVLYRSDEGVAVCAPSLPGCWSQGETDDEALANIAEAIREYLDAPIEDRIEPGEIAEVREIEVAMEPCRSSPASITSTPSGPWNGSVSESRGKASM